MLLTVGTASTPELSDKRNSGNGVRLAFLLSSTLLTENKRFKHLTVMTVTIDKVKTCQCREFGRLLAYHSVVGKITILPDKKHNVTEQNVLTAS